MILVLKNKDECKIIINKIRLFLSNKLHLELNDKSRYYPGYMGVNFCGYRIYECYLLVRNRCKKEIRRKIRLWNKEYNIGNINMLHVRLSYNSWF